MAKPASREELKDYCLRRLGHPVIQINVDEEQLEDRIDDALAFYHEYHHDGVEKVYLKHQITDEDRTNKYITIPEPVVGIVSIFPFGSSFNSTNLFSIRYQIALNDLYDFTTTSMVPYTNMMRHIELLEEVLVGQIPIRFNKHTDKLYMDMDWNRVVTGDYALIECYRILDPDAYTDVYSDRWLLRYTTAVFKLQWGENLKKFDGIAMPGGITFNGQKIWDEATDEIKLLEDQMATTYSLPATDMIGQKDENI